MRCRVKWHQRVKVSPLWISRHTRARARHAYLAAKVPRRLCSCTWIERTRRGGCANEGRDPDGNRFCMSLPFREENNT